MNKKNISVTVAICACNEGPNIAPLLQSILSQKEDGYRLDNILVISDGSTDNAVKRIKNLKSSKISIRDYNKRLGKSYRLNEIYSKLTSDFVVQPDADVILKHPFVIRDLIEPMKRDNKVGMTGGNPIPMKTVTFIEKAIETTYSAYTDMRKNIHKGNNIWTATGRLIALRHEVYSKIRVPRSTISNDHYVYFRCLEQGYKYRYADTAAVYFRLPQSLKDHVSQETRFALADQFMKKYFSAEEVEKAYFIPFELRILSMAKQYVKHPILCSSIFVLNRYCKLRSWSKKRKTNALWEIVYSTKKLVNYNDK